MISIVNVHEPTIAHAAQLPLVGSNFQVQLRI